MTLLKYQIGIEGQDKLRNVMRSIETEAESNARRGYTRDMRTGQQRVRLAQQSGEAQAAAEQRGAAKILAAREREERKSRDRREREEQRSADRIRRYEDRQYHQHLVNRTRAEQRAVRDNERARQETVRSVKRGASRVFDGTVGVVGGGMRALGSVGALLGGVGIANAMRTQMSEQALASQLANQAGDPSLKGSLLKESQNVKGFTGAETLGAISGFVEKTGDLQTARAIIGDMGTLALATSADFGELGEAAGQAFNVIRDQIKDPQKQVEALNDVMRTLAVQGTLGAVEIKDMASELATLGAATRAYEGGPVELLKTMGAMAQATVARGGAPSAAEASTAITRFAADLTKKPAQKALKGLGIDVFSDDSRTKLKDPREIMADILAKTGGDLTQIEDILNAESKKALGGFSPLYLDAEKKQKGTGKAALMAEFERFTGASNSKERTEYLAGKRLEDADLQALEAMKLFNREVGEKLVPELTKLIPKFTELTPAIGDVLEGGVDLAKWLADNPLKGLGLVVSGFMAKELASAGISAAVEAGMTRIMAMIAAKAAGGTVTSVAGDLIGGGGGAAAAKNAGKWLTKLAPAAPVLGAAASAAAPVVISTGAGLGAAWLGTELYQQSDYGKEQLQKSAKAKSDFYGYGVYAGVVPAGSKEQIHDPSFVKNVQATLLGTPSTSGNDASNEVSKDNVKAAQIMLSAATQFRDTADLLQSTTASGVDTNRTLPVLSRK